MSETVVFFGNERIATGLTTDAPVLRSLIEAGYSVAAVVASHEQSTSRNARDLEVAAVAKEHGIPLLLPEKLSNIHDQLKDFGAIAGVLIAYGKIIPQSIIDIFPRGIINIHPSLLPKHRGPTPIESVILEGDAETGVTLMQLAKAMDAGPIYAQSTIKLDGTETKQSLANDLVEIGISMLNELLPGILSGDVVAKPQDDSAATYDSLIGKNDGDIDWGKPAAQIEREIRAYKDWPKSRTTLAGKDVTISAAHAIPSTATALLGKPYATGDKKIAVATIDGTLVIDSLKPAGKSEMSAEAFLAGHKNLL